VVTRWSPETGSGSIAAAVASASAGTTFRDYKSGLGTRTIHPRDPAAQPLGPETSLRELDSVSLEDALGYLDLLAEQKPEKLERAAVRRHGRLETEPPLAPFG